MSTTLRDEAPRRARVVVTEDPAAMQAFEPNSDRVRALVDRAVTEITRRPRTEMWRALIRTQDVIGLKVYSATGPHTGTRPAVVRAVVEGLLAAGVPPKHIVIWDKQRADLRRAGFLELASQLGVRVEGSAQWGYDETNFYAKPIIGQPVYGEFEFGQKGEGVGRRSFVSKLVSRELTKIIVITPLLSHNTIGVSGNLFSLAWGSVDNTLRFESSSARMAEAVPEIYGLPSLADKVALCIVDALIVQYQGEREELLHRSVNLNEIRVSTDPVALDVLSVEEISRQRRTAHVLDPGTNTELYQNAALLELGIGDLDKIDVQRIRIP